MMHRKEKENHQSASDEERMTGDKSAGRKNMAVFKVLDNSEDENSAETETGEKCVRNVKTFEEEPSKGDSCVFASYIAKPLANNSNSGIEEEKSQKEIDVCKMRNLLGSAQERVRENMKKLSHCVNMIGKTSMEEKEVEKNNSMHSLNSSLKRRNSGTLEEMMNFERLCASEFCLGMTAAIDKRLKVIEEKLLAVKKDDVAGRPPMKSSVLGINVIKCDTDGIRKGDSENSIPIAELRYPDKMDKSFTKYKEHLQSNASELKVSFTDMEKESLNQQARAASGKGSDVSLNRNSKDLNYSFPDVKEQSVNEQACAAPRKVSDVSFNVKPEYDVPVTNSKEQGREDDPSLPNSNVIRSSKRSFPFSNRAEIIPSMKRSRVDSIDCSERNESRYLQSRELNCQNVHSILSPNRTLKVDLGFRCDSSEFQVDPRKWSKNWWCLSKESIHHLNRIKTENESICNENLGNVVSEQHQRVKREVEMSSPVKHGLMETFEVGSQKNGECQEDDHVSHPSKKDLLASIRQKHSLRSFRKPILSKESTSNRLETAEKKTEIKTIVEPVELEEEIKMPAMQMDCQSVEMEVEETECNSTISGIDEVEVLKVIKPVCVVLGYRCDSKEMLKKDNKLHLS